ncbi:hypothetical protein P8C59_008152 [Phyllachora maydis]|uniref:Uncharacterized protein n=1 Tax=Phyllachora maydis TaxID=1825666 RepID=A0AAD9IBM5_9PEZI|nr:hypothetical protein P8C59_008152 [Phyllachora maydis]
MLGIKPWIRRSSRMNRGGRMKGQAYAILMAAMEIDADALLVQAATDGSFDHFAWPLLLPRVITRIETIVRETFPVPIIPPPVPPNRHPSPRFIAPLPSSDPLDGSDTPVLAPGQLPPQIQDMLDSILTALKAFPRYPPHTIQRLAELVLKPKQHYRSLPAFLHALDRVVHVTSGANIYPLPPAVPDMSGLSVLSNGTARQSVNSFSSAGSLVGSDEALGGALLTPIPWLARQAAANGSDDEDEKGGAGMSEINRARSPLSSADTLSVTTTSQNTSRISQTTSNATSASSPAVTGRQLEAQLRTESTETIDGPNGVGSIETVSISLNGIHSMGASAAMLSAAGPRGVTQGEILRQEQRLGVVPVSQLARQGQQSRGAADGTSTADFSSGSSLVITVPPSPKREAEEDLEPESIKRAKGESSDNESTASSVTLGPDPTTAQEVKTEEVADSARETVTDAEGDIVITDQDPPDASAQGVAKTGAGGEKDAASGGSGTNAHHAGAADTASEAKGDD